MLYVNVMILLINFLLLGFFIQVEAAQIPDCEQVWRGKGAPYNFDFSKFMIYNRKRLFK